MLQREITVDTTDWTLRVHDGVTAGGHLLSKLAVTSNNTIALEAADLALQNRATELETF